jgi:hypothetical protein
MTCGGGVPALTCRHTGLAHGGASAAVARPPAREATGAVVDTYAVTQGTRAAAGDYTVGASNGGTPTVNPATHSYEKLNRLLADAGFDRHAEGLSKPHYADGLGRGSAPPGVYFRMLPAGYIEGLGPQRAVAW